MAMREHPCEEHQSDLPDAPCRRLPLKAALYARVELVTDITNGFRDEVVPQGTQGTIVHRFDCPEGYAVDITLPDPTAPNEVVYDNIIVTPDQFIVLDNI
jgi:hypothetical protein